jgi:hypothetical protein
MVMITKEIEQHIPITIKGVLFHQLTNKHLLEQLIHKVNAYWEYTLGVSKHFLAPRPASLERKDFKTLLNNHYHICAKYDGDRFLFFLTTIESICLALMIDRHMNFYIVQQNFDIECFQKDVLLDGEYMGKEFIVHDAFVINGESVMQQDLTTRINKVTKVLQTHYHKFSRNPPNSFTIRVKRFYELEHIHILLDQIKNHPDLVDGIVFYPINKEVGHETQFDLFKWKPTHTVDFVVREQDPALHGDNQLGLYVGHHRVEQLYATTSKKVFDKHNIPFENNQVVEFRVDPQTDEFIPERIRKDKPKGNSRYVVNKTLFNIRENIQATDLLGLSAQKRSGKCKPTPTNRYY